MAEGFSEALGKFIAQHIASVEQLEILLMLSQERDRFWSVDDIFKRIQSNQDSIAEKLSQMKAQGLLEVDQDDLPRYRFCPRSPDLASEVVELQNAYRQSRVRVIEAIFSNPRAPSRHFADAFKFKGKNGGAK